jgi:hypothetical protein
MKRGVYMDSTESIVSSSKHEESPHEMSLEDAKRVRVDDRVFFQSSNDELLGPIRVHQKRRVITMNGVEYQFRFADDQDAVPIGEWLAYFLFRVTPSWVLMATARDKESHG